MSYNSQVDVHSNVDNVSLNKHSYFPESTQRLRQTAFSFFFGTFFDKCLYKKRQTDSRKKLLVFTETSEFPLGYKGCRRSLRLKERIFFSLQCCVFYKSKGKLSLSSGSFDLRDKSPLLKALSIAYLYIFHKYGKIFKRTDFFFKRVVRAFVQNIVAKCQLA